MGVFKDTSQEKSGLEAYSLCYLAALSVGRPQSWVQHGPQKVLIPIFKTCFALGRSGQLQTPPPTGTPEPLSPQHAPNLEISFHGKTKTLSLKKKWQEESCKTLMPNKVIKTSRALPFPKVYMNNKECSRVHRVLAGCEKGGFSKQHYPALGHQKTLRTAPLREYWPRTELPYRFLREVGRGKGWCP